MPRKSTQPPKKQINQNIKNYLDESSASSNEYDDPQVNDTFRSPSSHNATNYSSKSRSNSNMKNPSSSHTSHQQNILTPLTYRIKRSAHKSRSSSESSQGSSSSAHAATLPGKSQQTQLNAAAKKQGSNINIHNSARNRPRKGIPKKKNDILKEINYQLTTNNLIPKTPFIALIRKILINEQNSRNSDSWRITPESLQALQESAELYLVQLFQDAYRCTIHRSRVTLAVKDMELVRFLRGRGYVGYTS